MSKSASTGPSKIGIISIPRVRSNFFWNLVGILTNAASQWLAVVVLARLTNAYAVGQYSIALALAAPIFLLSGLQLRVLQTTDAVGGPGFSNYWVLRVGGTGLAMLSLLGVAFSRSYSTGTKAAILLVGCTKAFESFSDLVFGDFQRREEMRFIGMSMAARAVLSITALAAGIVLTGRPLVGVAAFSAAYCMTFMLIDVPAFVRSGSGLGVTALLKFWRFDTGVAKSLLRLSWPLGIVSAIISLNSNLPRYFLEHSYTEREVGIYSALAWLAVSANALVVAMGQSLSPRMARMFASGQMSDYVGAGAQLALFATALGFGGIAVAVLAGRPLLRLYGSDYSREAGAFTWLMVASLLMHLASAMGYMLTSARQFRAQYPMFGTVVCTIAIACSWMVPRYGLRGGAGALILGTGLQCFWSLLILRSVIRPRDADQALHPVAA